MSEKNIGRSFRRNETKSNQGEINAFGPWELIDLSTSILRSYIAAKEFPTAGSRNSLSRTVAASKRRRTNVLNLTGKRSKMVNSWLGRSTRPCLVLNETFDMADLAISNWLEIMKRNCNRRHHSSIKKSPGRSKLRSTFPASLGASFPMEADCIVRSLSLFRAPKPSLAKQDSSVVSQSILHVLCIVSYVINLYIHHHSYCHENSYKSALSFLSVLK